MVLCSTVGPVPLEESPVAVEDAALKGPGFFSSLRHGPIQKCTCIARPGFFSAQTSSFCSFQVCESRGKLTVWVQGSDRPGSTSSALRPLGSGGMCAFLLHGVVNMTGLCCRLLQGPLDHWDLRMLPRPQQRPPSSQLTCMGLGPPPLCTRPPAQALTFYHSLASPLCPRQSWTKVCFAFLWSVGWGRTAGDFAAAPCVCEEGLPPWGTALADPVCLGRWLLWEG